MDSSLNAERSATVIVRTGGFTKNDLALLAAGAISAPIIFVMFVFLPIGGGLPDNWMGITVSVAFVAAIMMFGDELVQVRRVEIGAQGVSFRFSIHTSFCRWAELFPYPGPPRAGVWAVESRKPGILRGRWFRLTLDQSRALLSHPACPKWNLSPEVLFRLGMSERN
jgi:hypothetical protein